MNALEAQQLAGNQERFDEALADALEEIKNSAHRWGCTYLDYGCRGGCYDERKYVAKKLQAMGYRVKFPWKLHDWIVGDITAHLHISWNKPQTTVVADNYETKYKKLKKKFSQLRKTLVKLGYGYWSYRDRDGKPKFNVKRQDEL